MIMQMDYQIIVISEMHHDASGMQWRGIAPKYRFLWCDPNNLLLGVAETFDMSSRGRSTIKVKSRWLRGMDTHGSHYIKFSISGD